MSPSKKTDVNTLDVVIAGLGPTGLVLAHILGQRGHHVLVLEREPVFYGNARAVYTDDECMRVFQSIGMADVLQEQMLQETPVQFTRPDGTVMGQYLPRKRPFGWPVINFFYQPYLETSLTEALQRYPNVEVLRGRELTGFSQDGEGVVITHQATRQFRFTDASDAKQEAEGDPDPQLLRARYLIGADGGRSTVRQLLGIQMSGRNFPEPWLVVDLKVKPGHDELRHVPYFNFVVAPKMPVVCCVQPDGFHRFEFMLMPGMTREWIEKPDTVRELLSRYIDPDRFEIKRKLVYTFNAMVAQSWRQGRVLLAGDAAHMTPQFMGQGMSSGVRDAYNLGWKLDLVLKGLAGDGLLDSYELERRSHAKAMVDASVRMKDMVSMTSPIGTVLRDTTLRMALMIPALRNWLQEGGFKPKPDYLKNQYLGLPRQGRNGCEGRLLPQPEVRTRAGRRMKLDALLGEGFSMIGIGVDPRERLSASSLPVLDRLGARNVTVFPYGQRPQGFNGVARETPKDLIEVEDLDGTLLQWLAEAGHRSGSVALIRPDKFVFAAASAWEMDAVIGVLQRLLASPVSLFAEAA